LGVSGGWEVWWFGFIQCLGLGWPAPKPKKPPFQPPPTLPRAQAAAQIDPKPCKPEPNGPTLPPRWPHFLADASWSSKCTPAAPA
jgi:hypothetical protein